MKRNNYTNQGSTLFLKGAVSALGVIVFALCLFALPAGIQSENVGNYKPILLGMYATIIPFYVALVETLKLLNYIEANKAFSALSVNALKNIKNCAIIIGALYAVGMPFIYYVADKDDAPGVVLIGLVLTFAPLVIAVFAAVLQKLLQNAIAIKSENDLTV